MNIPPLFDPSAYRCLHQDLAKFNDNELIEHYLKYGRAEGRTSNFLRDRKSFSSLITSDVEALEIGPFASPLLNGKNVWYCDVLDQDELVKRAKEIGINPDSVPRIDYKLGPLFLDEISRQFDAILSSHSIEHQPDLILHLNQIERKLRIDGRYFALIPDKRYCFDREIAPSTIAEVIQAYEEKRSTHALRSVIEHRALTVHNDCTKHWAETKRPRHTISSNKVLKAIEEWRSANGGYIDVHAWYFTPESFLQIVELLNGLGLTTLKVEQIYPTRRNANEFWAILKNGECSQNFDLLFANSETLLPQPKKISTQFYLLIKKILNSFKQNL